MKGYLKTIILSLIFSLLSQLTTMACTSMLVSASASATGRPLMWKHRDSNSELSFIERVEAKSGKIGYVALFDAGDTGLKQAWIGMNDAGFAIMNTASYNLQPDTARLKDNEGYLMTIALQMCRTVNDFQRIVTQLPKPLGVQANFGVMDADGNLMYYEINDHSVKVFNVADSEDGYLIRTNFSFSGANGQGKGYVRYKNLTDILKDEISSHKISPEDLTDKASRSFYNYVLGKDFASDTCQWAVDQDFIPRYESSASVVIEGVNPGEPVNQMIMWTMIGYPPCSYVLPVTLTHIPSDLRPTAEGYTSPLSLKMLDLKKKIFPLNVDSGKRYINMKLLRPVMEKSREASLVIYQNLRNARQTKE